jgi:hypothetical protein
MGQCCGHCPSFADVVSSRKACSAILATVDVTKSTTMCFSGEARMDQRCGWLGAIGVIVAHSQVHRTGELVTCGCGDSARGTVRCLLMFSFTEQGDMHMNAQRRSVRPSSPTSSLWHGLDVSAGKEYGSIWSCACIVGTAIWHP